MTHELDQLNKKLENLSLRVAELKNNERKKEFEDGIQKIKEKINKKLNNAIEKCAIQMMKVIEKGIEIAVAEEILLKEKELSEIKTKIDENKETHENLYKEYQNSENNYNNIKNKENEQQQEVQKSSAGVAKSDEQQRKENKKALDPKTRQSFDNLITDILDEKITDSKYSTKETQEAIQCADKRQIEALAIFSIKKSNLALFNLVKKGVDVNFKNASNQSLLFLSSEASNYKITSYLIENGASISDSSVLYEYINKKNEIGCALLLKHDIDPECYLDGNKNNISGLIQAVKHGSFNICKLLIESTRPFKRNQLLEHHNSGTALFHSVCCKHTDIVNLLLEHDANPDCNYYSDKSGPSALIKAIDNSAIDICTSLLKALPQEQKFRAVNYQNYSYPSALYRAASAGKVDFCDVLITHGANPQIAYESSNRKETPLEVAVRNKREAVVTFFMNSGGDLKKLNQYSAFMLIEKPNELRSIIDTGSVNIKDARDGESYSLLCRAITKQKQETCELLLQHGAMANEFVPHLNKTLLFIAIETGNASVCQLLLDYGADPECYENQKEKQKRSGLMVAIEKNSLPMCEMLLKVGDINKRNRILNYTYCISVNQNKRLITSLYLATQKGYEKIVQLLIQAGADQTDINLHKAFYSVTTGNIEALVKILQLQPNIDIDAENYEGYTILCLATQKGRLDICELILQKGANVNKMYGYNDSYNTVLFLAVELGNKELCALLIKYGANPDCYQLLYNQPNNPTITPLCLAVKKNLIPIAELLLDTLKSKNNIKAANASCWYGGTALAIAARTNNLEMCNLLINKGVDPNTHEYSYGTKQWSALTIAVQNNSFQIFDLLVEALKRTNQKSVLKDFGYENKTTLDFAVNSGRFEMVQRLIDSGLEVDVDISYQNNGRTLLYQAAEAGYDEICKILINKGANLSLGVTNQIGTKTTPLNIATERGHAKVVTILQTLRTDAEKVSVNSLKK